MNWFLGRRKTVRPYNPVEVKCITCGKKIKINSRIDGTVSLNNRCEQCRRHHG